MSRGGRSNTKPAGLNAELEKALAEEIAEITKKVTDGDKKGQYVYDTVERMRVYDRALKLEQLKLKVDDPEWDRNSGVANEKTNRNTSSRWT